MSNENQQLDGGVAQQHTSAVPGRRRMAGYQPGPQVASNGTSNAAVATTPQPAKPPQAATPVDSSTAPQTPTAPARKTRMGQPAQAAVPQAEQPTPATPAPATRRRMGQPTEAAQPAEQAAPSRQRMGQPAAAAPAAGRQRMGGTPAAPAAAANTPADGAATRMGSATPAVTTSQPAASTAPATPSPAASAAEKTTPSWVRPVLMIAGIVVVGLVVVLAARWLRTLEPIQEFIATYDGHASQPEVAPQGMPSWMGWQHFLNMFFIVLIIRTGLQVRLERKPPAHWTAKKNSFFSPPGAKPKKVSLSQWLHQSLDVLWIVNGLLFVILLFVTDHWMRIVPTSWDIFPNMLSGMIQYASLDWPTENGWVHYNALQVMAYFVTVFIAAPLAVISGIRISTWWPDQNQRLNKIYPVEVARAIHFPVMLYFVVFTIIHVFLVFFTGALRNLNHMYTSRDVIDWWGLLIFLGSLVVIAGAWFLTQPLFTRPIAAKMGEVTK